MEPTAAFDTNICRRGREREGSRLRCVLKERAGTGTDLIFLRLCHSLHQSSDPLLHTERAADKPHITHCPLPPNRLQTSSSALSSPASAPPPPRLVATAFFRDSFSPSYTHHTVHCNMSTGTCIYIHILQYVLTLPVLRDLPSPYRLEKG